MIRAVHPSAGLAISVSPILREGSLETSNGTGLDWSNGTIY